MVVDDDDDVLFFKFIKKVLYIYSQISLKGHLAKIDGLPIRRGHFAKTDTWHITYHKIYCTSNLHSSSIVSVLRLISTDAFLATHVNARKL